MAGYMRIERPASDVKASTIAALQSGKGKLLTPTYATVDYSGWCQAALVLDQAGFGHFRMGPKGVPVWESKRTLSMLVRCRKCAGCLKERRMMWTARAVKEWKNSTRTWFVTLTLRPDEHYKLQTGVRIAARKDGVDYDTLEPRDRLSRVLVAYRRVMDLYLMRLRSGASSKGWDVAQFRYLWVPEPHKSGAIHFHMLLHEVSEDMPLVKRRIEGLWDLGFTKVKQVTSEREARYVTKYLGKHHFEGRVRASKKYGKVELEPAEQLRRAAFPGHVQGVPRKPYEGDDAQAELAEWRFELGRIPGEPEDDEVRPGEDLGAYEKRLYEAGGAPTDLGLPDDPYGTESGDVLNRHGVPDRKWALKGWNENAGIGRGAPGVPRGPRKPVGESVH